MKVHSLSYTAKSGWSVKPLPALDSERTLVLVFGAPEFMDSPAPIAEVVKAYPHTHLVGCSTSGEIAGTEVHDKSLSVAVIQFDSTRLATGSAPVSKPEDSFSAGKAIAEQLKQPDLKAVFIVSEGSHVNGSELVRGFNSVLPKTVVITGGLAGDGDRFQRTWVV